MKKNLMITVVLLYQFASYAQGKRTVSGLIISAENNQPVPGVNVLIKGTSNGTVTDFDGLYSIEAVPGDVLQFSYLGFVTQSITITNQTIVDITLGEDQNKLDDVIVVGYGTRKKSHLTGAIAKVNGKNLAALQVTRVDEALAGQLAGVRVQNTSSEPGAPQKIQIRAASSITSNTDPLIIVDGYQISGDLGTVNANDIESIEVLKDASSAAIYGSRGANGVILVTTKKGRTGKPSFGYNIYKSATTVNKRDKVYTSLSDWITNIENNRGNWAPNYGDEYNQLFDLKLNFYKDVDALGIGTDYEDNTFRTGISLNHDFNVRGGGENVKYFASVGYLNAEAAIQDSDFERYSGRVNIDAQLNEKFSAGISVNGIYSERTIFPTQLHNALRTQSFLPRFHTAESIALVQAYNQTITALGYPGAVSRDDSLLSELKVGDYAHEWHFNINRTDNILTDSGIEIRTPVGIGISTDNGAQAKIDGRNRSKTVFFANSNGYFDYEIIEGLNFKTTFGADIEQKQNYSNKLSFGTRSGIDGTQQDLKEVRKTSWLSENTLNYSTILGEKHDLNLIAGASLGRKHQESVELNGEVLISDEILTFGSMGFVQARNSISNITRQSGFFRANYAFDDLYLLSFSIRRDGDSRFGKENKWGNFPAASLGWNVHNESFFESISDTWSALKLRASYGSLGTTSGLGAYSHLSNLRTNQITLGDEILIAFKQGNLANPDLGWQKNTETNFGADLGFLNNKIRLGLDYFTSTTEDLLLDRDLPQVTGFNSIDINLGELESNGWEVELGTTIGTDNFSWTINASASGTETIVNDLAGAEQIDERPDTRAPIFRTALGRGISEFYGYKATNEVISEEYLEYPGYPINGGVSHVLVEDINNDGEINEDDIVYLGDNSPDFIWGLSNNFSYKSLDLSFTLQGAHGAEVANADPFYYETHWRGGYNDLYEIDNPTDAYRLQDKRNTDVFIQDASFVSLRNLTFGFTLRDNSAINKAGIESLRIYFASSNLLYLTASDYTSFNPEGVNLEDSPTSFGAQRGATPITRSISYGINLNF